MLPEIRLDNSSFEEIAREARSRIGEICPEWTDFNYHDPGITFVELFAYLKEVQEFHMDQIGKRHKRKFLKLLGMAPKKRCPAVIEAGILKEGQLSLPPGSRFEAGDLVFETEGEENLPGSRIQAAMAKDSRGQLLWREAALRPDGTILAHPFGTCPEEGNQFLLCLDAPLEPGTVFSLFFGIYDGYPVKRVPVKAGGFFWPLAELAMEYRAEKGWQKARVTEDESLALIQSGRIRFALEEKMAGCEEEGVKGFFLRLVLKHQEYDVAPLVTSLSFRHIRLVQRDTMASWSRKAVRADGLGKADRYRKEGSLYRLLGKGEAGAGEEVWTSLCRPGFYASRILGRGDGFPNQRFLIPAKGAMTEGMALLVESLHEPGSYQLWHQVEDFDSAGPEDLCYQVDEETGEILFGDSFHGMAPETEIRLAGCVCTAGLAGNIKAGKEMSCNGISCRVLREEERGLDKESEEECGLRAGLRMKNESRAVTREDYEYLVRNTPGLRVQAACVLMDAGDNGSPDDNTVDLAVRPFHENGQGFLNSAYRKNILAALEDRRLLGTRIRLHSPEYTEIRVYAEVCVRAGYLRAKAEAEAEIGAFFRELEGRFGAVVRKGRLYGRLDSLDCVTQIHILSVEARGSRIKRSRTGDLFLPPAGVALLRDVECIVVNQ